MSNKQHLATLMALAHGFGMRLPAMRFDAKADPEVTRAVKNAAQAKRERKMARNRKLTAAQRDAFLADAKREGLL